MLEDQLRRSRPIEERLGPGEARWMRPLDGASEVREERRGRKWLVTDESSVTKTLALICHWQSFSRDDGFTQSL